jgi:hypothetical protein
MLSNLKNKFFIFSNTKIDFKKVLSGEIWSSINDTRNNFKLSKRLIILLKQFLRAIYNSIVTTPIIKSSKLSKPYIFFIRKHSRNNIDLHTKCFENIDNTTTCVFKNRKIKIDFSTIFFCIFFLIKFRKFWLRSFQSYRLNFLSIVGLKIFIDLFESMSDSIKVLPILMKHEKLVSFQDHVMVENIICQIANKNLITTFGLQHAIGLYKENSSEFENRYQAASTYKPTVTQNLLVWGEYNKNIFKKFTNAKIFIIGKPDMPVIETPLDGVTLIFQDKIFKNNNAQLFEIYNYLKNCNVPTSLWFKPGHVMIKNCQVREGPLRKIVIGVTSSLCFELGFLGLQVFILKSKSVENLMPESLMLNDLDLIANNYKKLENYPHNLWKNFIECSSDESIKRYKNIVVNDK